MVKLVTIVLVLTALGTTLAFGGVHPITGTLMEVLLFTTLLFLLLGQTWTGKIDLPLPVWPLLFLAWAALELVPLPAGLFSTLAPSRAMYPRVAAVIGRGDGWVRSTVYAHETELALLKFLAYLIAFVLAAYVFDSRRRRNALVTTLVFGGLIEAVYGMIQYLTGWQKIFTYAKQFDLDEATGTYINRNHFAGLLELTLPFAASLVFYWFQVWSEQRGGWSGRHAYEASASGPKTVFYLTILLLMFLALLFSRSRMGILSACISGLFVMLLAQLKARSKAWTAGGAVFLTCVLAYGLWIGLGPVLARFEPLRDPHYLRLEGRTQLWKDSLRLIRNYPVAGTGLGTFMTVFRSYQTSSVEYIVEHAHNDYLELASETGVPGALLLFVPLIFLLGKMFAAFLTDERRYRRAITLGCIGSTCAFLLHSITDFNMEIPANALIFAVILGIGYKVSIVERQEQTTSHP